jgi:hypothetical protein
LAAGGLQPCARGRAAALCMLRAPQVGGARRGPLPQPWGAPCSLGARAAWRGARSSGGPGIRAPAPRARACACAPGARAPSLQADGGGGPLRPRRGPHTPRPPPATRHSRAGAPGRRRVPRRPCARPTSGGTRSMALTGTPRRPLHARGAWARAGRRGRGVGSRVPPPPPPPPTPRTAPGGGGAPAAAASAAAGPPPPPPRYPVHGAWGGAGAGRGGAGRAPGGSSRRAPRRAKPAAAGRPSATTRLLP